MVSVPAAKNPLDKQDRIKNGFNSTERLKASVVLPSSGIKS